jgi:hypothetical protein
VYKFRYFLRRATRCPKYQVVAFHG